jgi:CheY-like chemotaxis protein
VVTAHNDIEAIASLSLHTPDLIISDFRLIGGRDGLELARDLRTALFKAHGRTVPVIMLTGDIAQTLPMMADSMSGGAGAGRPPAALFILVNSSISAMIEVGVGSSPGARRERRDWASCFGTPASQRG